MEVKTEHERKIKNTTFINDGDVPEIFQYQYFKSDNSEMLLHAFGIKHDTQQKKKTTI